MQVHPLLVSLILLVAVSPSTAQEKPETWKAGTAAEVVTPEGPMWMAGYAARDRPSEGKVHDLFVKALALESPAGERLVIVTSDLISVPRPIRDNLERAVADRYQLPPAGLVINCIAGRRFVPRAGRWMACPPNASRQPRPMWSSLSRSC